MINNNNRTGFKAVLAVTIFVAVFAIQVVVAGEKLSLNDKGVNHEWHHELTKELCANILYNLIYKLEWGLQDLKIT